MQIHNTSITYSQNLSFVSYNTLLITRGMYVNVGAEVADLHSKAADTSAKLHFKRTFITFPRK